MTADEPRPEDLDEPANPYAEEDETGTPLTHSQLVALALASLAEHHAEHRDRLRGERHLAAAPPAAVDFYAGRRMQRGPGVFGNPGPQRGHPADVHPR